MFTMKKQTLNDPFSIYSRATLLMQVRGNAAKVMANTPRALCHIAARPVLIFIDAIPRTFRATQTDDDDFTTTSQ